MSTLIQNRVIKAFGAKIYKALQADIKLFTGMIKEHGVNYAHTRLDHIIFNQSIGNTIMALYKAGAIATANKVYGSLHRELAVNSKGRLVAYEMKYKTFGKNELWTAEVTDYFNKYLADKVVIPINETTKKFLLNAVNLGIDDGWSVDKIVNYIETADITKMRAKLIVRTESVRATNFGGMAGAYNNDFETEKVWRAVKDNRTRTSHRHGSGVDGEVRDLLNSYSNGLQFPGDPNGGAAEVCNCRCTQSFQPKRDPITKRLIRKPPPISGGARISLAEALNLNHILNLN